MATASSDTPARRIWQERLHQLLSRLARSWLFIVFFVGFFLFWEYSIDIFSIPRYILPQAVARSSPTPAPTSRGSSDYT